MYDWLLFLHLLAAFALASTVVTFSAVALGAAASERTLGVANVLWDAGGLGTLVFGIWLALDVDGYEIWDGWILGAVALWAIATELGRRARLQLAPDAERRATLTHWLRTAVVVALLALMVWKPGA